MAYRFLLEVPESLVDDASVSVEETGDAQVVVIRNSHALGYDDPYVDLTVAAHSLRVIDSLYSWFNSLGPSRPDIRLVLHGGDRLLLEAHDRGSTVAAIRRDQPWVERSIPRIGDHVEEAFTVPAGAQANASPAAVATAEAPAAVPAPVAPIDRRPKREITVTSVNHVALRVLDLLKAERFYTSFFVMEIVGRSRRSPNGALQPVGDYQWDEAIRTGTEADVTVLRNGPLTLALQRVGRGARIQVDSALDHLSISVDATTFTRIKSEVLMRGFVALRVAETAVVFRDPFGIAWEVTVGR